MAKVTFGNRSSVLCRTSWDYRQRPAGRSGSERLQSVELDRIELRRIASLSPDLGQRGDNFRPRASAATFLQASKTCPMFWVSPNW